MVGSRENEVKRLVAEARKPKSTLALHIDALHNAGKINVNYSMKTTSSNDNICFALVKKSETTAIKRGENAGVTLTNHNIVIDFKTISATQKMGNVNFSIKANSLLSEYQVIAFIQDAKTFKIIDATKTVINE